MKNPQAIALDRHGQIYVADTGNGRVLVFSATGRVIRTLKPIGKPAGVAVDPTGDVFISAIDRGRVEELSPSGILEHTWGTPGHKVGQFSQPTALALTKSGHILVTDTGNNRIVEITP